MRKPAKRGNAATNLRIVSIRDHDKLSRNDLVRLTGYSRGYVDQWLVPPTSKYWRRAPVNAMRLLEFETGRRLPARVIQTIAGIKRRIELTGERSSG